MWETTDPSGRRVVLTFERWRHILQDHPELAHARDAILEAVSAPAAHHPGHEPGEEWFYGRAFGPVGSCEWSYTFATR